MKEYVKAATDLAVLFKTPPKIQYNTEYDQIDFGDFSIRREDSLYVVDKTTISGGFSEPTYYDYVECGRYKTFYEAIQEVVALYAKEYVFCYYDFLSVSQYVIEKNNDLYQKLKEND